MNHAFDVKALELSRQAIALFFEPMPGVQLQAKIQNLFIAAMEFAAPAVQEGQPVSQPLAFFDGDISSRTRRIMDRLREMNGRPGCQQQIISEPVSQPYTLPEWIPCSERMPDEGGRYWCYVEEINSLGKSHYQWNCSWNGDAWSDPALTGRVTHWLPLPAAPQQEV